MVDKLKVGVAAPKTNVKVVVPVQAGAKGTTTRRETCLHEHWHLMVDKLDGGRGCLCEALARSHTQHNVALSINARVSDNDPDFTMLALGSGGSWPLSG